MIPRRLRRWLILWTPIAWLILELVTYPEDRPVTSGAAHIVGGFFSAEIAAYPAVLPLAVGLLVAAFAVTGRIRRTRGPMATGSLAALALVLIGWGVAAGGLPDWSPTGTLPAFSWLVQTVALLLVAAAVWSWGVEKRERAEATCASVAVMWRVFKSNPEGLAALGMLGAFGTMALLAPFLADHELLRSTRPIGPPLSPPNWSYYAWLGTDEQGLSILAEFIWSARISLTVGIVAALVSASVGSLIGVASGFYGSWRDQVGMRITDAFLVLPWLPLAMVLAAAWGQNYWMIIVIIGITSWAGTARIVRSQTLSVRTRTFVERARSIGAKDFRLMATHIFPNVFPLVFANTILVVGIAIVYETALAVLGLGDPLNFSWGTMLHNAWTNGAVILAAWWYLLPPGIAIVCVVVGFTLLGTALDEVLDPKLRKREESDTSGRRELGAPETVTHAGPGTEKGGTP